MQDDQRSDQEIEQLLIDRWLYRGGILVLLAIFAILLTVLSGNGLTSLSDRIVAGALVVCGIVATGVFVVMRHQDRALYRTLRDRRRHR